MSWDGSLGEALRLASASPQDRAAPGDRLGRECGAEDDISPGVAGREEAVVVPLVGAWGRDQGSELADEADAVEQDGVGSVPQATLQSVQHATIFQQGQTFCGERGAEEPRAVGYRRQCSGRPHGMASARRACAGPNSMQVSMQSTGGPVGRTPLDRARGALRSKTFEDLAIRLRRAHQG